MTIFFFNLNSGPLKTNAEFLKEHHDLLIKHILLLREYDGSLRLLDYTFNSADFWIRIYGLPLKWMTKGVGEHIGDKLGILKKKKWLSTRI